MVPVINPIEFITRNELEGQLKPGKPTFGIAKERSSYYFSCVGLFRDENRKQPIFIVWREEDTKYFAVNDSCHAFPVTTSPDKFVDYLFLVHPEYAEWFLFHPEWL